MDYTAHQRRSTRLAGHDYTSSGLYFVTLVTFQRQQLFGKVEGDVMRLDPAGEFIAEEWRRSAEIRHEIELDDFVVMPNHLHALVAIVTDHDVGAHGRAPLRGDTGIAYRPLRSLGSLIAGFKSAATKRIKEARGMADSPIWQRNYYEHIVRDEDDLNRIRQYIFDNPANWDNDSDNTLSP